MMIDEFNWKEDGREGNKYFDIYENGMLVWTNSEKSVRCQSSSIWGIQKWKNLERSM